MRHTLPATRIRLMIYIAFFAIIFVFNGCSTYWHVQVIVENTTSHSIKIEGFYTEVVYTEEISEGVYEGFYEEVGSEVITIQPYGHYLQAQNFHPEDSRYYYLFLEYPIDSVYITFDEEKVIVQSCEEHELGLCGELVERNILAIGLYYDREDIDRKEYNFTYQITEEDYDRALPIN